MKIFRAELQVRGYELDGYGHVNHAVYLNFAEYARWRMIEDSGSGGAAYFQKHQIAPVVVRVEVDYKEPCFLAEWLEVETTMIDFKKRVALFRQRILKKESKRLAAELIVTVMVVDKSGKAVSLPADFHKLFGGGVEL